MKIGKNLKELMHKHGLNTMELSRKTGIGQPVIYRLATDETDNPKITTLLTLANFFGLTVNQLVGDRTFDKKVFSTNSGINIISWESTENWFKEKKLSNKKISDNVTNNENIYVLQIEDCSMEPLFVKDTLLFIDGSMTPSHKSYAVIKNRYEKKAIFRQVIIERATQYLVPLNLNANNSSVREFSRNDKYCGVLVQSRRIFV